MHERNKESDKIDRKHKLYGGLQALVGKLDNIRRQRVSGEKKKERKKEKELEKKRRKN